MRFVPKVRNILPLIPDTTYQNEYDREFIADIKSRNLETYLDGPELSGLYDMGIITGEQLRFVWYGPE